jgi:hypothetical protein
MTEGEQRYVIKFLDAKKFTLNRIVAEIVSVYGEQAYTQKAVVHWVHQVKLGSLTMEDEVNPSPLPLDDIDRRILVCLSREPYLKVRLTPQVLGLAPAIVFRRLTISLDMKPRYFRWVPSMLTPELREQCVNGSRPLLVVLRQQEKIPFGLASSLATSRGYSLTRREVPFRSRWTRSCQLALDPQLAPTNRCSLSSGD